MTRPRIVPLCAVLLVGISVVAGACDAGLQAELDQKKTARYKKAAEALAALEAERTKSMADTLPAKDAQMTERKHPMVLWRSKVEERDDAGALDRIANEYKGTPAEAATRAGVTFTHQARNYWRGEGNLDRYYKFLHGYLAEAKTRKETAAGDPEFVESPFQAEAAFDILFVHAARFYQLANLPPDTQIMSAFPYWQLAFGVPSHGRESFSGYVTRVCRMKELKERCQGVPHELRPAAINKPYLEWLKKETTAYLASHDLQPFKDVIQRYDAGIDEALAAQPDLTEDPVLPATFSDRAASQGLLLSMSPKRGVFLLDQAVSESFDGSVPGNLAEASAAKIEELKNTPGNQVDFERVVVEMPGDLSGDALRTVMNAFPKEIVRQFDLVGRRRSDESLRRTGVLVRLPAPDEGTTTSFKFASDADKTTCDYLGVAGKPPIGRKEPGSYLVVDKGRIRAAKLTRDETTRELSAGEYTLDTSFAEKAALQTWADANPGIVRLFVSDDFGYDEIMQIVSSILYQCQDTEVALDERGKEKITISCGKAEERDVTLVFAMCE